MLIWYQRPWQTLHVSCWIFAIPPFLPPYTWTHTHEPTQSWTSLRQCQVHLIEIAIFQVKWGAILKYYLAGKIFSHWRSPTALLPNPSPAPPTNKRLIKISQVCANKHKWSQFTVNYDTQTYSHLSANPSNIREWGVFTYVWFSRRFSSQFWACWISGCAHPPSNLEVNPLQNSTGMLCHVCLCMCEREHTSLCAFLFPSSCFRAIHGGMHMNPQTWATCRPNYVLTL